MTKEIRLHLNGTVTTHTDVDEVMDIVTKTIGPDFILEDFGPSKYGFYPDAHTPKVGYFEIVEVA